LNVVETPATISHDAHVKLLAGSLSAL